MLNRFSAVLLSTFSAKEFQLPSNDDSTDSNKTTTPAPAAPDDYNIDDLKQAIENATGKSSQTQTDGLRAISDILRKRYLSLSMANRKEIMLELLERSLRRGAKDADQEIAVKMVPQLVLQLGEAKCAAKRLGPLLLRTVQDRTATPVARANCCTALALLVVLAAEMDDADVLRLLETFRSLWGDSRKGEQVEELAVAALDAWSLVLTLVPNNDVYAMRKGGTKSTLP